MTIELNQDSHLDIRAALIQQDVRHLHEKITRLERLIEMTVSGGRFVVIER